MVNVATLVKRSHLLKDEHRELMGRLEQLRNDQLHNNYIPAELFRFIEDLRAEVTSLRSMVFELMEEKRSRVEEEERRARIVEEERRARMVVFQFDRFSAPNPVTTAMNVEDASCTMTYSGTGHNYAISSIPLPRDRPSQWQVDIISHHSGWVMLGVIGTLQASSANSYSDATCYAWAASNQVYIRGSCNASHGSWVTWQTGDRGIFTYDPIASTLALRLVRAGAAQEFRLDSCALTQAFIHVNFHANGTSLRLSNVNSA